MGSHSAEETLVLGESRKSPPAESTAPGPRVVALVGPAGTGKSHRASIVANSVGAGPVLDDGLLISGGKILAGRSAKREPNRVAAIRRALLEDPKHAADIREALAGLRPAPTTVLIIGISEDMVRKVAANLGLPAPSRLVAIEEVASPRQMRKARQIRASQGKHVIPAPTLEVRKSFAGYTVDPLKVFVKVRQERPAPGQFIEKSVVRPTWSSLGRFYIEEVVLAAIAAGAAVEVPGVARVAQAKVESGETDVGFEMAVAIDYGAYIPDIAARVGLHVRDMVEHMTGLLCRRVNVRVSSVAPPSDRGGPDRVWGHK